MLKFWTRSVFDSEKQIPSREGSHIPPGEKIKIIFKMPFKKGIGWPGVLFFLAGKKSIWWNFPDMTLFSKWIHVTFPRREADCHGCFFPDSPARLTYAAYLYFQLGTHSALFEVRTLKKKRVAEGGTTAFFFVHSLTKRHSKWFASSKNISIFGVYIQTHVRFFPMVFWGFRRDATGRRITEKHFNQVILFQFFSLRYVIRRLVAGIGLAIKILIYATNSSTILTTRFDLSLFSNLRSVRREQWR